MTIEHKYRRQQRLRGAVGFAARHGQGRVPGIHLTSTARPSDAIRRKAAETQFGGEKAQQPASDQAMVIVLATLVAYLLPGAAGCIAWRMARASYVLVKHGIRTTGQVTVAQQRGSIIQYSVAGLTYQFKSEWYVPASVGATAPVVYPPGSPDRGCVYHWQELWMSALLWLLVAVFFGVLDIWY